MIISPQSILAQISSFFVSNSAGYNFRASGFARSLVVDQMVVAFDAWLASLEAVDYRTLWFEVDTEDFACELLLETEGRGILSGI